MNKLRNQVHILIDQFNEMSDEHIATIMNARPEITDPRIIFAALLRQALYETTHNIPSKHQSIIEAFLCL